LFGQQRLLVLPGSGAGQWPLSWQRDRPIKRRFSGNDCGLSNFHGLPDISSLLDGTCYFFGELALSINNG
jgi:hypothetical protein